jgi:hypothetical protein
MPSFTSFEWLAAIATEAATAATAEANSSLFIFFSLVDEILPASLDGRDLKGKPRKRLMPLGKPSQIDSRAACEPRSR